MSVRSNLFSRLAVLGAFLALPLAFSPRLATASTLTVDSALSSVAVGVSVGVINDDEGNPNNPVTGDPYQPGDTNPDDGTPVIFIPFGTSIGQGNLLVPPAVIPGGVASGTSDGSSAQLNGNVDVTPAGFSINSSTIGINNSGLWQPGLVSPGDANGPPSPSGLGLYIDLSALLPGEYVIATLNGLALNLGTATAPLGGGGAFVDPNASLTVTTATLHGFSQGPLAAPFNTTITNVGTTTTLAGTYTTVGPTSTLNIPALAATTYQDLTSAGLPGVWAQVNFTGNVVATATVPEPSTLALAGFGLVGMALAAYRRNRK